ncbi:PUS7, partial [Symbiodinium natans]
APNADEPVHLTGCMRRVIVRPEKLSWYLEPNLGVPDTDWADLPGKAVSRATNTRTRAKHLDGSKSLVLDFHLGPGQYATMAMREVMRPRPSKAPQHHVFFSDTE